MDWTLMLPELIVIATAFVAMAVDLLVSERGRRAVAPLSLLGLAAAVLAAAVLPSQGALLGGRFAVDSVTQWFKVLFLLAGFVTVILSRDLLDGTVRVRVRGVGFPGEFYTLLLFTVSGMMYLISARDLVTLYVSLELATIPLFVLAAWQRDDPRSGEAGLKYVVVGAMASAFILYGFGLLYGLARSTDLDTIGRVVGPSPVFWLAAALVMAGVGFKLTIVPFHMWAADVYEGAPMPVTAYLSVASKATGLAFLFQVFFRVIGPHLEAWGTAVALLAAATMTLGNVVAIVQENIKRFMAFSAISQAGYLIMGFLTVNADSVAALVFYLLVYIVTNLTVFGAIIWYANETGRERIQEYRGLSRTNPLMALVLMVALFSLAGIPPLSGFVGKFFLFSIASQAGFHWLVAVAAVNSTVSLYYYLRIVRQMYIEPLPSDLHHLPSSRALSTALGVLTAAVVLLGVVPHVYRAVHASASAWHLPLFGV
ncbi:MAG: NADH-quinone oxidoreductase subunit N [Candidatus Latescibacterota bacterium]